MTKTTHIAVCVRYRDAQPEDVVTGSKPDVRCDLCDAKLWRSPATKKRRRQLTGYRCRQCASSTFMGVEIIAPLTQDQIAEVVTHMKRRTQ